MRELSFIIYLNLLIACYSLQRKIAIQFIVIHLNFRVLALVVIVQQAIHFINARNVEEIFAEGV